MNRITKLTAFKYISALWLSSLLLPAQANDLLNRLQAEARQLHLAEHQQWLDLLHAETDVWGNVQSQVDDPDFFISPQGKQNPYQELMADIKAFVENDQMPAAQCRFPARFYWLKKQLKGFDAVEQTPCEKFIAWRDKVGADSVTLAFPSMYLNNPGSMFGHTFLRLDKSHQSPLLSYTLSYTARTDDKDSFFVYAYKGITGGYPGYFTTRPYYDMIQEYGDIEHRDIWEYRLDLKPQEVDQMLRHLWELSGMNIDYFFLRENCAYRLLEILDVARPGLNILQKNNFPFFAIPVDTVRAVVDSGIVEHINFRPSISSRLQQMYQQLDKTSQQQSLALADKQITVAQFEKMQKNKSQRVKVFQLASEIRQFKKQDDNEILLARSRLGVKPPLFTFKGDDPQNAHGSSRLGFAPGQEEGQNFIELSARPSFHDLMDRPAGFLSGSAISGLDLKARWFSDSQTLKLQTFEFFSMTSLSSLNQWSSPLSGRASVALQRYALKSDSITPLVVDGGLGLSRQYYRLMIYGLASGAMDYSTRLEKNGSVFLGFDGGALLQMNASRIMLSGRYLKSVAGMENKKIALNLQYQHELTKNQALRLEWSNEEYLQIKTNSVLLHYLYYF